MPTASHKKILIAVNSLEEAFKNSLENKSTDVIYIKTSDLKEWSKNENGFVSKVFGDQNSGMFLNFIYKDGDKEFEKNNLESKILDFKLCQLLNQKNK